MQGQLQFFQILPSGKHLIDSVKTPHWLQCPWGIQKKQCWNLACPRCIWKWKQTQDPAVCSSSLSHKHSDDQCMSEAAICSLQLHMPDTARRKMSKKIKWEDRGAILIFSPGTDKYWPSSCNTKKRVSDCNNITDLHPKDNVFHSTQI